MSDYETIFEDLARAKKIIATGTIVGGEAYAAFELLQSFTEHVENYQLLLAVMGATDYEGAMLAWRAAARVTQPYPEDPRLYDAARDACHACGLPWVDPRSGITYPPP